MIKIIDDPEPGHQDTKKGKKEISSSPCDSFPLSLRYLYTRNPKIVKDFLKLPAAELQRIFRCKEFSLISAFAR
jgi:hypothetical protein